MYYFHVYLRGNHQEDIFYDKVDLINAWNRLWISAAKNGVRVLAAIFLHNHFHVFLAVPHDGAEKMAAENLAAFMHHYRMSISAYYNHRYHTGGMLGTRRYGRAEVKTIEQDGGDDQRDLVCYIGRNMLHHGISSKYLEWRFSTARHIFARSPAKVAEKPSEALCKAYLPYPHELPEAWKMEPDGMIIPPEEVFDRAYVESLFGSRKKYLACMAQRTRREENGEEGDPIRPIVRVRNAKTPDSTIASVIEEHFGMPVASMNGKQRLKAAIYVKEQYPFLTTRQLSRVTGVPRNTLEYHFRPL